MAPKCVLALLLTLALIAAALQPSASIRDKASFKPTEDQDSSEKIAAVSTNSDVAQPSSGWSFPLLPPLPPFPALPPLPPFPALPPLPPFPALPPLPPFPSLPPLPPLFPPWCPSAPAPPADTPSPPSSPSTPAPPADTPSPPSSPSAPAPSADTPSPPSSPTAPVPPADTPSPPSPSTPQQPTECRSSLMELMPCKDFITNMSAPWPTNPSTCCDGFNSLVDKAPICLCHVLNGDIDELIPAVIKPRVIISLPDACDVLGLPVIQYCDTEPVPPLMPAPPQAAQSSEP